MNRVLFFSLIAIVLLIAAISYFVIRAAMPPEFNATLHYRITPPPDGGGDNLRDDTMAVVRVRLKSITAHSPEVTAGIEPMEFIVRCYVSSEAMLDLAKYSLETTGKLEFKIAERPKDRPVNEPRDWKYTAEEINEVEELWKKYNSALIERTNKIKGGADPTSIPFPEEPDLQVHKTNFGKNNDGLKVPPGRIILRNRQPGSDIPTKISSRYLANVYVSRDEFDRPGVGFKMKKAGAELLGKMTEKYRKRHMAIVLEGVVRSAPTIQGRITTNGQITGDFTMEEINTLIITLNSGELKGSLECLKVEFKPKAKK